MLATIQTRDLCVNSLVRVVDVRALRENIPRRLHPGLSDRRGRVAAASGDGRGWPLLCSRNCVALIKGTAEHLPPSVRWSWLRADPLGLESWTPAAFSKVVLNQGAAGRQQTGPAAAGTRNDFSLASCGGGSETRERPWKSCGDEPSMLCIGKEPSTAAVSRWIFVDLV